MFIDMHVHTRSKPAPVGPNGAMNYGSPEYLLQRYDVLGIEHAVILPGTPTDCANQIQSNEEALEICERHPGRFLTFCNVDPRMLNNDASSDLGMLIAHYKAQGCRGCGEVQANMPFTDPRMAALFRACEAHEMPVTFHVAARIGGAYGIYDDLGLPLLEQTLEAFPDLIFLGHSQCFWSEISANVTTDNRMTYPEGPVTPGRVVELMRKYPNLHGDISAGSGHNAVSRDEAFGVAFLTEFQDRLYFGTDICAPNTPTPLVDTLLTLRVEGKISEEVFHKVAFANAARLLRLGE